MAYQFATIASQIAAMRGQQESPAYRRGVAQMTKVPSRDFLLPADAEALQRDRAARLAGNKGPAITSAASMPVSTSTKGPVTTPAAAMPASTGNSFMSQLGAAYDKIAPDLFRGIAAGLASYQGDPMRPYSGVGEAIAGTMQRSEQTREARRQMSLAEEFGTAEAKGVAAAEREMNRQNMGDFRGMVQKAAVDTSYIDDLAKMEGFRIGVPSSGVNKAMLAYTAANPFSATERERMDADLQKRLASALRISF